jgi:hypothetical protein
MLHKAASNFIKTNAAATSAAAYKMNTINNNNNQINNRFNNNNDRSRSKSNRNNNNNNINNYINEPHHHMPPQSDKSLKNELRSLLDHLPGSRTTKPVSQVNIAVSSQYSCYEEEVAARRSQARRSILFTGNHWAVGELDMFLDDCLTTGADVREIHVYNVKDKPSLAKNTTVADLSKYVLVEFGSPACVNLVLRNYATAFNKANSSLAFPTTRMLFCQLHTFRDGSGKQCRSGQFKSSVELFNQCKDNIKHTTVSGTMSGSRISIDRGALKGLSTHNQIDTLYDRLKIDESGFRMRYFIASILEEAFHSMFKGCMCLPFGSSSNRFGMGAADLDLSFTVDRTSLPCMNLLSSLEASSGSGSLVEQRARVSMFTEFKYLTNRLIESEDDRQHAQDYLFLVEFVLNRILPKFRIRNAIKSKS